MGTFVKKIVRLNAASASSQPKDQRGRFASTGGVSGGTVAERNANRLAKLNDPENAAIMEGIKAQQAARAQAAKDLAARYAAKRQADIKERRDLKHVDTHQRRAEKQAAAMEKEFPDVGKDDVWHDTLIGYVDTELGGRKTPAAKELLRRWGIG